MRNILLILSAIALIIPSYCIKAQETNKNESSVANLPVLKRRDYFGIYLGESCVEVQKRAKAKNIIIKKRPLASEDENSILTEKDMPQYTFEGALNDSKTVIETKICVYSNRVASVQESFKEATRDNFRSMKAYLKEKYGTKEAEDVASRLLRLRFSLRRIYPLPTHMGVS